MAKRVSNTARYFPHNSDASAGDTMTILQNSFKNDGYAFWFRLLERLTAADDHYLVMSNPAKWRTLAGKSFIDVETADKIMDVLLETEAIDPELWYEHRIIWCRNLLENLRDVYRNRRRPMPQRPIVNDGIITCSYDDTTCNLHVDYMYPTKQKKLEEKKLKEKRESSSSSSNNTTLEQVLEVYSDSIGGLNIQTTELVRAAYESYTGYWVVEAIREAVRQNKARWSYVEGILRNWKEYGFKNVESKYHITRRD